MKWLARVLLTAATLLVPGYLLLDRVGLFPVWLRDRPWPLALLAVLLAILGFRIWPRLRRVAVVIAVAAPLALLYAAHLRYRLPPASATVGVGALLPDLTLADESGRLVRLRALLGRPILMIWFRGSWCPYCRRQLAELAAELPRFSADDFRVLAVSPDPPEPMKTLKAELRLPFSLLSDPDRQLMNACQLGHCVAILDGNGAIRWGVISGNWEKDLPARSLLQAAYRQK